MPRTASDTHRIIADPMRILVRPSPQFDLCYALAELLAPEPRIPPHAFGLEAVDGDWLAAAGSLGWSFWLALPDALVDRPPIESIGGFIEAIGALTGEQMAELVRRGLFHSRPGERPQARKREWLHFVGLDTAGAATPGPGAADVAAVADILRAFGRRFEPLWNRLLPQLTESARKVENMARSDGLATIARALDLSVECDSRRGRLSAPRGGWSISEAQVGTVYLIPGAFNLRRLFHAADEERPAVLFFPYRAVDVAALGFATPAPIDPWLVSRALGDPTRAAIVRRLAREPRTATQLLEELGLSKATVSHHIFHLREAGLIDERRSGKSIVLSLRRATLDGLSDSFRLELGSDRSMEKPNADPPTQH